jgi:glycosyltransferase involved in cell wall biosynthesis
MKLNILICTIPNRVNEFNLLKHHLQTQINELGMQREVKILSKLDNKEISVGAKRQLLLEEATADYVVYIDDDDMTPYYYVANILSAIESNPDCIGFLIECKGTKGKTASASSEWNDWADNTGGFDYVRTIYHKNPVKRSIALQIGYKDMRFAEDYDYSKRLKESGLLQEEVFINEVMYEYRYAYEDPKTKYGG